MLSVSQQVSIGSSHVWYPLRQENREEIFSPKFHLVSIELAPMTFADLSAVLVARGSCSLDNLGIVATFEIKTNLHGKSLQVGTSRSGVWCIILLRHRSKFY